MPITKLIPVAAIEPPDEPMRVDSLRGDDWEDFKESLAGVLLQPIGVRDLGCGGHIHGPIDAEDPDLVARVDRLLSGVPACAGGGAGGREDNPDFHTYRLIWGMRRTMAYQELGKREIMAVVFGQDEEADEETFMVHENFARADLNLVEEARFYDRLMEKHRISAAEVARRCRKPYSRVIRLLEALGGDPAILEAMREGKISQAQAEELNQVRDEEGRRQMLHYSRENGISATFIRRWREQREASGVSISTAAVAADLAARPGPDYRHQVRCQLHNEFVNFDQAPPRIICDECWQLLGEAMSAYRGGLGGGAGRAS